MKVQTAVLLLCFLSGVFLSVVHAKPSPALMRELVALEKYLEKKEGLEGVDGQNENPGDTSTDAELKNMVKILFDKKVGLNDGQVEENKPPKNEQDKPKNENNNNVGDETNIEEGSGGGSDGGPQANEPPPGQEAIVQPGKPEAVVAPEKEGSGPSLTGEEGSTDSGVVVEGEKPQEGNRPSSSEAQVKNEREQIFAELDYITRKLKDLPNDLSTLGEEFRKQLQNDDFKIKELEEKFEKTKEKTANKLGQLKTVVDDFKNEIWKQPVQENAPARRSHISDTEFLNMLHSLLTYS